MAEYFFELLTEEIPAWMHDAAQATLLQQLTKLTQDLGEPPDDRNPVIVNSTPRRIIFFLSRIPLRESDRDEEVKGPPVKAAYDAEGKPTQALLGFLKKNNATLADVIVGSGESGVGNGSKATGSTPDPRPPTPDPRSSDYIRVRRTIKGRSAGEILAERVPQIIESLRWPKMMRWGKGEHSYIRPIHSVVSVLAGEHLPITIFGIASGTTTRGHRTLAPNPIDVTSYNDYVTQLELNRVVIDAERRRHVMAERARVLGAQAGGTPSVDASIWSQWQYLTEYPGVVRAEFGREYLALPDEVLVTVMRVHQKQLPIRDANEKLTNSFLAVLDNDGDPDGNAAYGNSFVTNARFADAKFFYETDRKRTLESRLDQLAHLQFQEKLGTYNAKTLRIEQIVTLISDDADASTAARLCKTDLVTEMVREFTDLQGKIGGIYAREEGLPPNVWQAIYDHYLPVNVDDPLPRTLTGAIVSLADKIDTLVGFFRIDAKPTGSKDPFALRRAAQGVVQILLNRDKRCVKVGLDKLIEFAILLHGFGPAPPPSDSSRPRSSGAVFERTKSDLLAFFAERVRTILEASAYGFAYDEIAAAMEAGWASSLTDLVDRITALKAMRGEANFLSILDSAKRIANITSGQETAARIDPSKFENDVERRLSDLVSIAGDQIEEMIAERDYKRALETFAALAPELETFFDEVMVMVEDEGVRRNRMALLRTIGNAVMKIADVTKIVVDRREYRP
ncbi:MAG: glycyl-tRNA synthetase beta chain [Thermoanaerobaculia bacterium]|jgi:glycyl-tRNA synthetase beta chain|nr:glycyl-tRNA synthetase beta chain [Thermoanaerobaculia bacterium]